MVRGTLLPAAIEFAPDPLPKPILLDLRRGHGPLGYEAHVAGHFEARDLAAAVLDELVGCCLDAAMELNEGCGRLDILGIRRRHDLRDLYRRM